MSDMELVRREFDSLPGMSVFVEWMAEDIHKAKEVYDKYEKARLRILQMARRIRKSYEKNRKKNRKKRNRVRIPRFLFLLLYHIVYRIIST